jgi:precorrin-2/cobalt-factor-2 C20-methyltransferase
MTLYAVGVGPGDPELLTLKGQRLIASADVIFAPTGSTDEHSLALEIASPYIDRERQEIVLIRFPITPSVPVLKETWEEHARTVAARLAGGGSGVCLVEGDPSLYGSFNHLRAALREHHPELPVEVVPGVSSLMAAAAAADMPLSVRDERVAVLSAIRSAGELADVLSRFESVVLLKVSTGIDAILDGLESAGRVHEATWIRRAGMPEQEIEQDVRRLRGTRPDYFSMIVVRKDERT